MKRFLEMARLTIFGMALAGFILFPGASAKTFAATPKGISANTLHFSNSDKKVDITVEIHGKVDAYTAQSVEAIIQPWLEAAHVAVVNADGVDILELHIVLEVDDDGKGWNVASESGEWHEDHDVDTLDALNDILHEMINHFIEKFVD
jgi:hypothetical protein